jgi:hypothetical protein
MKKTVALAIIGLATATSSYAQGTIQFDNYSAGASYNQIVWDATGLGILDPIEVQLLWSLTNPNGNLAAMNAGVTTTINTALNSVVGNDGPGGWITGPAQTLGGWDQVGKPGVYLAIKPTNPLYLAVGGGIWLEPGSNILNAGGPSNNLVGNPVIRIAIVPEPSTFALAGLGAAALLIFRRRE